MCAWFLCDTYFHRGALWILRDLERNCWMHWSLHKIDPSEQTPIHLQWYLLKGFLDQSPCTVSCIIVLDRFHGDETLLTTHEIPSFSFLTMSAKLMIFNNMKPSMKHPLRPSYAHDLHVISDLMSLVVGLFEQIKVEDLEHSESHLHFHYS